MYQLNFDKLNLNRPWLRFGIFIIIFLCLSILAVFYATTVSKLMTQGIGNVESQNDNTQFLTDLIGNVMTLTIFLGYSISNIILDVIIMFIMRHFIARMGEITRRELKYTRLILAICIPLLFAVIAVACGKSCWWMSFIVCPSLALSSVFIYYKALRKLFLKSDKQKTE